MNKNKDKKSLNNEIIILNSKFINKIICSDALDLLRQLESDSIDVALTDPPYFLDKLDNNWDSEKVAKADNQQIIKSLPAGMKFDREQKKKFYSWYLNISKEIFRVLKPGGFSFHFPAPGCTTEWHRQLMMPDLKSEMLLCGFIRKIRRRLWG